MCRNIQTLFAFDASPHLLDAVRGARQNERETPRRRARAANCLATL